MPRGQLNQPGGYHPARAAGIAECLRGVKPGAAREKALSVRGEVCGKTSGALRGGAADPARAAASAGNCRPPLRNCRWRCPTAPRGLSSRRAHRPG
ncbi:hypothetical protein GCM10010300_71610 [Streptomyces olivaceoviridis]|nr:hypothetical protein GCM10010300_71610 [Streptomyces olivaceoviridis]